MNILVFLIRILAGFSFVCMGIIGSVPSINKDTPEWHANPAAAGCGYFLAMLYFWGIWVDARRGKPMTILPTARSITIQRVLTFGRWSVGWLLGLATVVYFLETQYLCGFLSLLCVVSTMPPLDRFFFAPVAAVKATLKFIPAMKILPNLGVFIAFMAIASFQDKKYTEAAGTITGGLLLLLVYPAAIVLRDGWKALRQAVADSQKAIPQPAAVLQPAGTTQPIRGTQPIQGPSRTAITPGSSASSSTSGASPSSPGSSPLPPGTSPSSPGRRVIVVNSATSPRTRPAKPGKRKYHSAKAWHWNWPLPKEAQRYPLDERSFNWLIRGFEASWLEFKDYHRRLALHRNPIEFKREIITDLEDYIQLMRLRPELLMRNTITSSILTPVGSVPDEISKIWKADKHLRSLFRAIQRFCDTPTKQSIMSFRAIAPHIAEYRAMSNLIKKLKHSLSRMPGDTPATTQSRRPAPQQPAPVAPSLQPAPAAPPQPSAATPIPSADERYFEIIDYLIAVGKNFEHYPDLSHKQFDEQWYRDYFLPGLNTRNPEYSAKGEVYNRRGKTDILVFDKKGTNLLIAECKLWKGEAYLREGVDQILHRYVNWRDEKTAIIIFNRDVKNFTGVIETATKSLSKHPLCRQEGRQRTDCSWSYLFHHPNDEARVIRLELILLNFV